MSFFSPEEHSRAPRSQPVYPWSAHSPPFGLSPSPFPRHSHALSTSATAAGELYLSGGYVQGSKTLSNDLYVISTQSFSATLLQTSGDVPSPRFKHRAVLTSTTFLIWGGVVDFDFENSQNRKYDDSFYLLNLGTSDPFHVKTRSC
jgi:Kelch motif